MSLARASGHQWGGSLDSDLHSNRLRCRRRRPCPRLAGTVDSLRRLAARDIRIGPENFSPGRYFYPTIRRQPVPLIISAWQSALENRL